MICGLVTALCFPVSTMKEHSERTAIRGRRGRGAPTGVEMPPQFYER
jgi:hypothetical protein